MFGLMRNTSHRRAMVLALTDFDEQLAVHKERAYSATRLAAVQLLEIQALRGERTALEAEVASLKGRLMAFAHKHGLRLPDDWGNE